MGVYDTIESSVEVRCSVLHSTVALQHAILFPTIDWYVLSFERAHVDLLRTGRCIITWLISHFLLRGYIRIIYYQ